MFHDRDAFGEMLSGRCFLGRCFRGFVLPVLEYCSAVWCSAADTHLKLLDRRSVAVLCVLYKFRCNPVHPLYGALPGAYVIARVTRGALVAHRYTYAPPRCRSSQYRRTFIPFSISLWDDLANPVFDGVGLAGFKSRANASLLA